MELQKEDLKVLLELGVKAALKAGEIIQSFDVSSIEIKTKEEAKSRAAQVLTEADIKSQESILSILESSFSQYDLGLLTEESIDDNSRFIKDYFWCIDPLDGTLPFTENSDGYCINIALVGKDGKAVLGIVYNPKTKNLYCSNITDRSGVFKNGELIKPLPNKENLTLVFDRSFLQSEHYTEVLEYLKKKGFPQPQIISHGGAGMNAIWVLEADTKAAYFKFPKKTEGGGSIWDYAATNCIFNSAELFSSTSNGNCLPLNHENTFMNEHGILYCNDSELALILKNYWMEYQ